MFNDLLLQIESIVKTYGIIGVFMAGFLEEVIAPIPNFIVAVSAGFFLIPPDDHFLNALLLTILKISLPMGLGITLGSLVIYALGYFGGRPGVQKYGKLFGLNWSSIEKIEKFVVKKHIDEFILLFLRIFPLVPNVALSVFCGLINYPVKTFIVVSFIGSFIRTLIMALIGWKAREAYIFYIQSINKISFYIFLVILALIILFTLLIVFKKRRVFESSKS